MLKKKFVDQEEERMKEKKFPISLCKGEVKQSGKLEIS